MKNKEAITTLESESCYECSWGCESPVKCNCPKCDLKSAVNTAIDALQENDSLARTVIEVSELLRKIRPRGDCRDRLKEAFREASETGGDLFHLSQIERIIDGEDWL